VLSNALKHKRDELATTIISVEEQLSGWYTRLRRARKRAELAHVYQQMTNAVEFLAQLKILSFTEPAIDRFHVLKGARVNVAANDLRIAAIVLEQGGTLITRNIKDFQRVPNLNIEDWSL
jgi:tRNA(fMet)-specific endonuclease VapC